MSFSSLSVQFRIFFLSFSPEKKVKETYPLCLCIHLPGLETHYLAKNYNQSPNWYFSFNRGSHLQATDSPFITLFLVLLLRSTRIVRSRRGRLRSRSSIHVQWCSIHGRWWNGRWHVGALRGGRPIRCWLSRGHNDHRSAICRVHRIWIGTGIWWWWCGLDSSLYI